MPTDDSEPALAAFWTSYVDSPWRGPRYLLRHPVLLWRAVRATLTLPVVEARPSDSPGGRAIRATLDVRGPMNAPARVLGAAMLQVPSDPLEYVTGSRAQTLRRKIRAAEKVGVTHRAVTDPDERLFLMGMADHTERHHPDPAYRVAEPENHDLLLHDLWLVAEDREGTPLLLSVTPVDGELATLRYFRTLGSGPAHSDARYLMTYALVAQLAVLGVRWLIDTEPPGAQKNGLRHFQRMVGFRYARVRLRRGAAAAGVAAGAGAGVMAAYVSVQACVERASSLVV